MPPIRKAVAQAMSGGQRLRAWGWVGVLTATIVGDRLLLWSVLGGRRRALPGPVPPPGTFTRSGSRACGGEGGVSVGLVPILLVMDLC